MELVVVFLIPFRTSEKAVGKLHGKIRQGLRLESEKPPGAHPSSSSWCFPSYRKSSDIFGLSLRVHKRLGLRVSTIFRLYSFSFCFTADCCQLWNPVNINVSLACWFATVSCWSFIPMMMEMFGFEWLLGCWIYKIVYELFWSYWWNYWFAYWIVCRNFYAMKHFKNNLSHLILSRAEVSMASCST